jgi:hypothetical protein
MVVKCKRGRRRYIAFSVSPDLGKDDIIKGLRYVDTDEPPYVVQCTLGKAILRCSPKSVENAIRIMSKIDPASSSLMTSGTICTIRSIYPELKAAKRTNR